MLGIYRPDKELVVCPLRVEERKILNDANDPHPFDEIWDQCYAIQSGYQAMRYITNLEYLEYLEYEAKRKGK
jgi:hypothetical protein